MTTNIRNKIISQTIKDVKFEDQGETMILAFEDGTELKIATRQSVLFYYYREPTDWQEIN